MLNENDYKRLAKAAIEAREYAYTPYSHFKVGAALLDKSGKIYTGCNIENAAFTPTNCAERTAFFKAISEGSRDFAGIAVAGGTEDAGLPLEECAPCGVCRQVMMEFCRPDSFEIILARSESEYRVCSLMELLPSGFGPGNLLPGGESAEKFRKERQ
ncbi:MAG: cytidine deaminase [Coprococcus sp.]